MRLLTELKRRKVFLTAAIYAASAWLLLQVAEFLLQMLEIPAWGLKLVFVVLLVGFPLALVLSSHVLLGVHDEDRWQGHAH